MIDDKPGKQRILGDGARVPKQYILLWHLFRFRSRLGT